MKFWTRKPSRVLTSDDFTHHVVKRLSKQTPRCLASIQGDLKLRIETESGSQIVHLDRYSANLVAAPTELATIVQDAVRGAMALTFDQATEPLTSSCVMPMIKSRKWLEGVLQQARSAAADKVEITLIAGDLNVDLVIAYVRDLARSVDFLGEHQLEELGVPRDELREIAVANLMARIESIEPVDLDGLLALDVDGVYEASLLLFDYLWDEGELPIEGSPVVAVPNRDVLIAVSADDLPGISRLRHVAEQSHRVREYPISPSLYIRREGRWETY